MIAPNYSVYQNLKEDAAFTAYKDALTYEVTVRFYLTPLVKTDMFRETFTKLADKSLYYEKVEGIWDANASAIPVSIFNLTIRNWKDSAGTAINVGTYTVPDSGT